VDATTDGKQQPSGDFQTALGERGSLLAKSIVYTGEQGESPALKWDSGLSGLKVSVEVRDALENKVVEQKDNMTSGRILRNGYKDLSAGIYKVTYNANHETASEYLVIGSPKTAFENLKRELNKTIVKDDGAKLNIEAQVKRGETLFSRANYDVGNDVWQEKAVYTLGNLASMISEIREGRQNISRDRPGLHIRGFRSKIDGSTQYYRIFIPSNYDRSKALPLLLVMPTPFTAREKPFIESAFMANHREAERLGQYAEKHGFAILWPGYKNAPEGFTWESTHVGEVINAVEDDYNIDEARVSIYGTCGGGYFSGRLVATYPNRLAAIVYNRAVFERDMDKLRGFSEPLVAWYEALNPADEVIGDSHVKIFVLNDGVKHPGSGDIETSKKFVERAGKQRSDVESRIADLPLPEAAMWDIIFNWVAPCKNDEHGTAKSDAFKKLGYEGPVSEIFATPFLIVKGTTADAADEARMESTVGFLTECYKKMFYGAVPMIKNDGEVTEQEIKERSLILVGNAESNAVWKKLEGQLPITATGGNLSIKGHEFPADWAFTAIFAHPMNPDAYVLTIGASDLKNLGLACGENPCRAWYDCRAFDPADTRGQTHIISKFNVK